MNMVLLLSTWNLSPRVRPFLDRKTFLDRFMDPESVWLYSHDPWAGWGAIGWEFGSMWRDTFPRPPPQKSVADHPLRPSTAGHPDGWRAAHLAHTYHTSDAVRWPKWNLDRV